MMIYQPCFIALLLSYRQSLLLINDYSTCCKKSLNRGSLG
ncbi:hypothetical protein D2E25_1672 [Bifidobacterium goeldii]|uniref:Uncharacterized protein n=1 Tax=Bifidobacterium goeldii TaxID=2306975 RepID=A0A430FFT4_9BIFI|nr:hypothetical protein D2E25_1672 [Bifidobacterium goeldii]